MPPEESEKARDLVFENLITVHDRSQRVVERISRSERNHTGFMTYVSIDLDWPTKLQII